MRKPLVLVGRLPGADVRELTVAGAPWLDVVRQVLDRVGSHRDDVDVQVRLRPVDHGRVQSFRMVGIGLPPGVEPVDVRVKQEHERVAKCIVRADVGEVRVCPSVDVFPRCRK